MYERFKRTLMPSALYQAETGYKIDTQNEGNIAGNTGGYRVLPSTATTGDATFSVSADPDVLTIDCACTSRADIKGSEAETRNTAMWGPNPPGFVPLSPATTALQAVMLADYLSAQKYTNQQTASCNVDLEVFLRSREPTIDTHTTTKHFFSTTRALCCCVIKPEDHVALEHDGIVYESTLSIPATNEGATIRESSAPTNRPTDDPTIRQSELLQSYIRREMLQSLVSPRRTTPRPLTETEMFTNLVLPWLLRDPVARVALRQPISTVIPDQLKGKLAKPFLDVAKQISRLDLLLTSASGLARTAELDQASVHKFRSAMLTRPFTLPRVPSAQKSVQRAAAISKKQPRSRNRPKA
jgi:hypothetical protein